MTQLRSYYQEIIEAVNERKSRNKPPSKVKVSREVLMQLKENIHPSQSENFEVETFEGIPMEVIETVHNPFIEWVVE